MSQEIQTFVSIYAAKNNARIDSRLAGVPTTQILNMAGTNMVQGQTQNISHTAWTAVSFGSLSANPGMWEVLNTDGTNYVQFSLDNAGTKIFGRLQALQKNLISLEPGATIYGKANTADVVITTSATDV